MRRAVKAALFLLPVMFLLPNLSAVPFGRGAEFSDLLVSHYPNALFLQRTLFGTGSVPLWSPLILSGYPFAANPLSSLFYPPAWVFLLLPLPLGINGLVIAHLLWGGAGMYLLLREEGVGEVGSIFGALTFEAMPKLFSHLAAGHITLIFAVAWTPWLLFVERRFSAVKSVRWLLPGFILGIIALADMRWAAYSGLIWLAYTGWRYLKTIRTRPLDLRSHAIGIARVSLKVLIAAAVAAPLLLPLMEYTRISTRSLLTAADIQYLSLPFGNLLGVLYPAIGGASEWILYTGAATLALAGFSAAETTTRRRAAFWLVLIPLTVIVALGSNIPWLRFLTTLPGMSLLRVPPRILFLTGMCFSAAAAYGLDTLVGGRNPNAEKERDRALLVLFALTVFSVMLAVGAWVLLRDPQQQLARIQFTWGAVFLALGVGVIFARRTNRLAVSRTVTVLFVLVLVDVISINSLSLEFRSLQETISPSRRTAVFLQEASAGEPYRVYSPSYSLPQHAAAWYALELADGVDPLQMAAYSRYMEAASGVPAAGYSVTLPPFTEGNPSEDNRGFLPDARLLGLLNVRYVVSAFPLAVENLELLRQEDQTWIYHNRLVLPRAWVQEQDAPIGTRLTDTPIVDLRPNRIVMTAEGPGLLVLSELAYPGWEVSVDGRPGQIQTVEMVLRGVQLETGSHEVVFIFRPRMVMIGLLLSLLTCAGWALTLYRNRGME